MLKRTLIAALLSNIVYGCNSLPAPQSASHPVALDLTCPKEPAALTDAQVKADVDQMLEMQFELDEIMAGRACRDTLHRICQWHKDRGAKVDCDKPG